MLQRRTTKAESRVAVIGHTAAATTAMGLIHVARSPGIEVVAVADPDAKDLPPRKPAAQHRWLCRLSQNARRGEARPHRRDRDAVCG